MKGWIRYYGEEPPNINLIESMQTGGQYEFECWIKPLPHAILITNEKGECVGLQSKNTATILEFKRRNAK